MFIPPSPPRKKGFWYYLQRLVHGAFWTLTFSLLATLLIAIISPWFSDRHWLFDLACHFQVQYVWLLVGFAMLFLIFGRWRWASATVAAALLTAGVHILPLYLAHDLPPQTSRKLRILSANLECSNEERRTFFELVDHLRPDVILLFELSWQWKPDLKMLEGDYPYSRIAPSAGHSGCGIYSRLPLSEPDVIKVGPYPNFVVTATVDCQGTPLRVFGTHPLAPYTPAELEARNGQMEALAKLVGPDAKLTVVAGDLNTTSWSRCFTDFLAYTGLRDTRHGFGVCASFPADYWPVRITIDHCLASSDIGVIDRQVGPDIESDHLPIIIDLKLP